MARTMPYSLPMDEAADSDGWIEWNGGECPLDAGTHHELRFRDGVVFDDRQPHTWDWSHRDEDEDIVAYRVIEEPAAPAPANDNRPNATRLQRAANINDLVSYFHGKSASNGWWSEADRSNPFVVPTKLMLAVSELCEAMEGHRKSLMDDKLPHRKMIEVELGDALIRIFDMAGFLGLDLGGATMEKDSYNDVRADHKPDARKAAGGKAY